MALAVLGVLAAADDRPPGLRQKLAPPPLQILPQLAASERKLEASGGHRKVGLAPPPGTRRVWRRAIRSPGAVAMRVHFSGFSIGSGRVWLHDGRRHHAQVAGPYTGRGIFGDGDFWSDVIYGDTVVVEYEPQGSGAFRIPEISHLWDRTVLGPRALARDAVRRLHVSPMSGGLDRYLVKELAGCEVTLVPEPAQADAVLTEGLGRIELVAVAGGYPLWFVALPNNASQSRLRNLAREIAAQFKKPGGERR